MRIFSERSPVPTCARRSLALSASLEKDEFVRMNQKNIDLWKAKIGKD